MTLESLGTWMMTHGARILAIVLTALGLWWILKQIFKRIEPVLPSGTLAETDDQVQQARTLLRVGRDLLIVLIVGGAVLMVMSEMGINVAPLLAGAGVAGLAIGLGAQTLVRDLIGGIFILMEDQFAIGDTIRVGQIAGNVERITLRATWLRDLEGRLHVIPNGEVRIVSNYSKEWSRAVVNVGVSYEDDLEAVMKVLEEVGQQIAEDPRFGPLLLEPPVVPGVVGLDDWAITVRIMVKTLPGKHWEVGREMRRRIKETFQARGITIPYPRQEVWVHMAPAVPEGRE